MPDTEPPLPRTPDDPGNVNRLRREAMRRLDAEGREPREGKPSAMTVYGGPLMSGGSGEDSSKPGGEQPSPMAVYGGPPSGWPPGPVTRRWTLARILLLVLGLIAALTALFFGTRKMMAPVYGGPPPPPPGPAPTPNPAPLYGGPPVQPEPHPGPGLGPVPKPHPKPHVTPERIEPSSPPAAVYGGPPPNLPKE